jgi:hypothetical protein
MSRAAVITISVIAFFLVLLAICAGAGVYFFRMASDMAEGPVGIVYAVDSPLQVEPDTPSIDVYNSWRTGIQITSSEPAWRSSTEYFGEFISYDYQLDIPAGQTQIVKFQATPIAPGDYEGDFDACINNEYTFLTQVVRTIVAAPDAEADSADESPGDAPAQTPPSD